MLLYPACACTKQVYLHLHLLHCHLHITMCHHLWTMCEHYCVNIHLPIASLNAIVPCMCMHKASLSTSTSTTLPLAYHHMSPSVNIVWTLLCEHPSTNCFFKCYCTMHVYLQSMFIYIYMYYTATCISPCVNNVWTLLCEHQSTNCFFKCYCTMYVHAQSKFIYIYIYYTATCISPYVTICEHCVNTTVWTSIYQLFL